MKGIDNFGQHVLIIVIFQLWNICLFPLFTWVYSFYSYTYRSVDAKITKTAYPCSHTTGAEPGESICLRLSWK